MVLHDLHLEYYRHVAAKMKEKARWHRRLLAGHIEREFENDEDDDSSDENLFYYTPRPWWRDIASNNPFIRRCLSVNFMNALIVEEGGEGGLNPYQSGSRRVPEDGSIYDSIVSDTKARSEPKRDTQSDFPRACSSY